MPDLQSRIKRSRISKGLSQAALANLTGISQPTVANWENGSHVPRQKALERIGKALDVDMEWLLAGTAAEDHRASRFYLSLPIQHVPIVAISDDNIHMNTSTPVGYVPFSSNRNDLFAVATIDEGGDVDSIKIYAHPDETGPRFDARAISSKHSCLADIKIHTTKVYGM